MVNLNAAEPHFIRCIKPNLRKAPANFDKVLVTKQLRYTGLAVIRDRSHVTQHGRHAGDDAHPPRGLPGAPDI